VLIVVETPAMNDGGVLLAAFADRAARLGVNVQTVGSGHEPAAVGEIAWHAGARSVSLASNLPEREALEAVITAQGLHVVSPESLGPDARADLGVSLASMAVAETGSLLLHSSAADRRVEMCVDVHVILVAAADLQPTLDDALARIAAISADGRSYVSLITGPSRSADIELQPAVGVHGPRELHVVLIGPADRAAREAPAS
jgi:L-lactate dehydrogenase complex protein LldG